MGITYASVYVRTLTGKWPWTNGTIAKWQVSLNEIDVRHFLKLPRNSMVGHQLECKLLKWLSMTWEDPLLYCYWLHETKHYISRGPANTPIGLLMTRNKLYGLMSLVSIRIGQSRELYLDSPFLAACQFSTS